MDIIGKGIVDTIHAGGDFGKLALVNHAPRAATIIVAEENTQFFKVHKDDFDRILSDVEANMIRLHEHGKNVLVLLKLNVNKNRAIQMSKISTSNSSSNAHTNSVSSTMLSAPSMSSIKSNQLINQPEQSKFVVIQGTREKMIDYCLENKFDNNWNPNLYLSDDEQANQEEELESDPKDGSEIGVRRSRSSSLFAAYLDLMSKDTYFQDLISTHVIYMSTATICNYLEQYYFIENQLSSQPVSLSTQLAQKLNLNSHPEDMNDADARLSNFTADDIDHIIKHKKRVTRFLYSWKLVIGFESFFTDSIIMEFLVKVHEHIMKDNTFYGGDCLRDEITLTSSLMQERSFFDMSTRLKGKKIKANLTGAIHVQDKQSDFDPPTNLESNQYDLLRRPSSAASSISPSPSTSPRRQLPKYPANNMSINANAPSLMINDVSLPSPSQVNKSSSRFNNLQLNQVQFNQSSSAPGSPHKGINSVVSDHVANHSSSARASPSSPSQAAMSVATSFVNLLTQGGARSKMSSNVKNNTHSPKHGPKVDSSSSNCNSNHDVYGQRVNNTNRVPSFQFQMLAHPSNYANANNVHASGCSNRSGNVTQQQPRPSSASSGSYVSSSNFMNDSFGTCVAPVKSSPGNAAQSSSSSSTSFSPTFLPSSFSSVSSSFLFNPTLHLLLTQRQPSASSSSLFQIEQGKQYYLDSINSSTKDGSMVTSKIFFPDPITDRDDGAYNII